jgi:hypothetical protein
MLEHYCLFLFAFMRLDANYVALVRDADIEAGKDTLLAEQEIGPRGDSKLEKRIAAIRARSLTRLHAKASVIGQETARC